MSIKCRFVFASNTAKLTDVVLVCIASSQSVHLFRIFSGTRIISCPPWMGCFGVRSGNMATTLDSGSIDPGRALPGDIVLCSWARYFTLTVPFSTQVCKWVRLASHPLPATETTISSGLMDILTRVQPLPTYPGGMLVHCRIIPSIRW